MNFPLVLVLILALLTTPLQAKPRKSWWQRLFDTKKVEKARVPVKHKKVHASKPAPTPTPAPSAKSLTQFVTVDALWMAKYWEEVAVHKYSIPEEEKITFKDGKYSVPIVVFRHYEDMVNASSQANLKP